MKTLRFDSVGGASGDMILSALASVGADLNTVRGQLASLELESFEIREETVSDHGLNGIRVSVDIPEHNHAPHRRLKDIRNLIAAGHFSDRAKALSTAVFERLADAEARVHNATPETIHFHEVAGTDSIVDIVGGCIALDLTGVEAISVGPLPLGCGTTCFSHGVMPVPVPATVELLKGHPVVQTNEQAELVTPTGAALLMTWTQTGKTPPSGPGIIVTSGNGFGRRELQGRPNLLRAAILETTTQTANSDRCLVLECNVDDTVPELIGSLSVKLLEAGALDVFTTAVQMKKQRPGTLLTVLARPQDRPELIDTIFSESTTFGIREYETTRSVLGRRHEEVKTPYGMVRVKVGSWKGRDITRAPEYEDCLRRAEDNGVAVRIVYEAACRAS